MYNLIDDIWHTFDEDNRGFMDAEDIGDLIEAYLECASITTVQMIDSILSGMDFGFRLLVNEGNEVPTYVRKEAELMSQRCVKPLQQITMSFLDLLVRLLVSLSLFRALEQVLIY